MEYDLILRDHELQKTEYLQPNDSLIIEMSDEMKRDIESLEHRDLMIKNLMNMYEGCIPIGLNYLGKDKFNNHRTKVFYHNPRKAYLDNLHKK